MILRINGEPTTFDYDKFYSVPPDSVAPCEHLHGIVCDMVRGASDTAIDTAYVASDLVNGARKLVNVPWELGGWAGKGFWGVGHSVIHHIARDWAGNIHQCAGKTAWFVQWLGC